MSKQDRQGVRNASDLERKYGLRNFGESFAEVMGLVTDARRATNELEEKLVEEVERLNTKIEQTEDRIVLSVADTYATNDFVGSQIEMLSESITLFVTGGFETKGDAVEAYNQLESMIQVKADEITLAVSGTYETKTDSFERYEALESQIQVASDSILLSVSETYETKSNFQTWSEELGETLESTYAKKEYVTSQIAVEKGAILLSVQELLDDVEGELELKIGRDENDQIVSMLNASASVINITSNRLTIDSTNFSLSADGTVVCDGITARNGDFSGTFSNSNGLGTLEISGAELFATQSNSSARLWSGHLFMTNGDWKVTYSSSGFTVGSFSCDAAYPDGSVAFVGNDNYIRFASEQANLTGTWTSDSAISVTSDADKKHDIQDITEAYSLIFDNLKPRLYKYNDGTSNRIHVGFIAQEVEEAILAAGLTTQDFAAFVRAEVPNIETGETETVCLLRYEEFIALNTLEIQKLKGALT